MSQHVDVYHEPGRYGGWPANHGIWSWGDEILVGFSAGHMAEPGSRGFHLIDKKKPEEHLLAKSRDGGETWNVYDPSDYSPGWIGAMKGRGNFPDEPEPLEPHEMDFSSPYFCMTCRMVAPSTTKVSRIYCSGNRGGNWTGPFELPGFGVRGTAGRTDYIIGPEVGHCQIFLTAMKEKDGREGRPFMAETIDGGLSWRFVAWMSEEPGSGYSIMPSTVRLRNGEMISAIRKSGLRSQLKLHGRCWIEIHRSFDDGQTWGPGGHIPVPDAGRSGNPGHLLLLKDGRLVLTYGYRRPMYRIRATVSEDDGKTWRDIADVRSNAGGPDIGYTRSVQRTDGKIVTIYYWHDKPESERYIAATIWEA